METFDVNNLPANIDKFKRYTSTVVTRAYRVNGPFTVITKKGAVECQDGYVVLDAKRVPHAMDKGRFESLYKLGEIMQKKKTTPKPKAKEATNTIHRETRLTDDISPAGL